MCKEGEGWIDKEDVEETVKGMEVVIDTVYLNNKISQLENELNRLKEIHKGATL